MLWMGNQGTQIWRTTYMRSADREHIRPKMDVVMQAVARAYGFQPSDFKQRERQNTLVHARHVSMLLCRILTMRGYPAIANQHYRLDHTTSLHACKKLAWLVPLLEATHTPADPPEAWAATAARLHPLPTLASAYVRRVEGE
jgi:hypothetical protein